MQYLIHARYSIEYFARLKYFLTANNTRHKHTRNQPQLNMYEVLHNTNNTYHSYYKYYRNPPE